MKGLFVPYPMSLGTWVWAVALPAAAVIIVSWGIMCFVFSF